MPEKETTHVLHMRHALDLANEALADGDWPVAAVIARGMRSCQRGGAVRIPLRIRRPMRKRTLWRRLEAQAAMSPPIRSR